MLNHAPDRSDSRPAHASRRSTALQSRVLSAFLPLSLSAAAVAALAILPGIPAGAAVVKAKKGSSQEVICRGSEKHIGADFFSRASTGARTRPLRMSLPESGRTRPSSKRHSRIRK